MVPLTIASAWCDAKANGFAWWKSYVAPHLNCIDLRNAVVLLMMLPASCDTDAMPMVSDDQKCHIALHFDYLSETMAFFPLVMLMLVPVVSQVPKTHVTSPFHHLDQRNGMVPLMTFEVSHCFNCVDFMNTVVPLTMPLISCAGYNSGNHWKIHVASHFDHLELTNALETGLERKK